MSDDYDYDEYNEDLNDVDPELLNDYNFITCIGSGAFAKVFLAEEKSTNKEFAIKIIDKEKFDKD